MSRLFGIFGPSLVLVITMIGVVVGLGFAGATALRVFKRCKNENKPIPWNSFILSGTPIVGAVYSNILMQWMLQTTITPEIESILSGYAIGVGLIIALSMAIIGKLAAIACNELSEGINNFNSHVMKIGAMNAVAMFAMIFALINMP